MDEPPRQYGSTLRRISKKKWAEGKRQPFPNKGYRGIVSKSKGRAKAVSAYMAMFPYCELSTKKNGLYRTQGGLIDRVNPPGWQEYKLKWRGDENEFTLDPHHCFGRRFGDAVPLLVTVSRPVHDFIQGTRVGRLLCISVKAMKGEWDRQFIKERTGKDQLGDLENDLENGIFEGNCRLLAEQLIAWNPELEVVPSSPFQPKFHRGR